jgi:uncharacterized protein YwgA
MERLQRASVLLSLNEELRQAGSGAGETHMQKATYFLQELMNVPLGFDFVMYKHGPFSFDLRDELTSMRAQGFLNLEPQHPIGPALVTGDTGDLLKNEYKQTTAKYLPDIRFVSEKIGSKTVAALERTATALYVTLNEPANSDRVRRMTTLKPQTPLQDLEAAVLEVDAMIKQAGNKRPMKLLA